jgi:hypothetical protein
MPFSFRSHLLRLAVFALCGAPVPQVGWSDQPDPNPLLEHLLNHGIELPGTEPVTLPSPTCLEGLDGATVKEQLEPIYQRHGWERFSRNSQVAPFELKLGSVHDRSGNRIGHTVSLWFIAHGDIAWLEDAEALDDLAADLARERREESSEEFQFRELDDVELERLGIERHESSNLRETFVHGSIAVLNRVQVRGVGRTVAVRDEQSLVVAWELDPRFAEAEELSSEWRAIERSDLGELRFGPAETYGGYGGYGKITRLSEPEGALLVECHVVVHEPADWFAGSNALRSKIPLGIQENVRKFRRELRAIQ